jgi:hypothetical protein
VAKFRREGWIQTVDHDIVVHEPKAMQAVVSRPRR